MAEDKRKERLTEKVIRLNEDLSHIINIDDNEYSKPYGKDVDTKTGINIASEISKKAEFDIKEKELKKLGIIIGRYYSQKSQIDGKMPASQRIKNLQIFKEISELYINSLKLMEMEMGFGHHKDTMLVSMARARREREPMSKLMTSTGLFQPIELDLSELRERSESDVIILSRWAAGIINLVTPDRIEVKKGRKPYIALRYFIKDQIEFYNALEANNCKGESKKKATCNKNISGDYVSPFFRFSCLCLSEVDKDRYQYYTDLNSYGDLVRDVLRNALSVGN